MDFIRTRRLFSLSCIRRHALEFFIERETTMSLLSSSSSLLSHSKTKARKKLEQNNIIKIKLKKKPTAAATTTMTTTIRYNYVFAFIHYYCLTALSASLFLCANVHCCTKRFLCGRSLNSEHRYACRVELWYILTVYNLHLLLLLLLCFVCQCQKEHNNAQIFPLKLLFNSLSLFSFSFSFFCSLYKCIIKICR